MSKSKNNVVEPKDIIAKFGADTQRVSMFAGPPTRGGLGRIPAPKLVPFPASALECRRETRTSAGAACARDGWRQHGGTALRRLDIHSLLRQVATTTNGCNTNTVISVR